MVSVQNRTQMFLWHPMMSVFNIGFITLSLSQSYVPQGDTYKYCCSTGWSQRYENIPGQKGENSVKLPRLWNVGVITSIGLSSARLTPYCSTWSLKTLDIPKLLMAIHLQREVKQSIPWRKKARLPEDKIYWTPFLLANILRQKSRSR